VLLQFNTVKAITLATQPFLWPGVISTDFLRFDSRKYFILAFAIE